MPNRARSCRSADRPGCRRERTIAGAAEGRLEDRGVARHRKFREGLARRAGERVERVGFALLVDHIVEERAERRAAQLDAGIGDDLDQPLEVEFGRDRGAGAVEHFERPRFLAELGDPRFERFVEREQPGLERLASADVVEGAPQPWLSVSRRRAAASLRASARRLSSRTPELGLERARFARRLDGGLELQQVVGKDRACYLLEGRRFAPPHGRAGPRSGALSVHVAGRRNRARRCRCRRRSRPCAAVPRRRAGDFCNVLEGGALDWPWRARRPCRSGWPWPRSSPAACRARYAAADG